ncbi:MAG: IS1595 family transposase [Pseudomonadota bacterium]|nr:IS1595 family transposase [Pseudomonadota bacterium]
MNCCTFDALLTQIGALSSLECTRLLTALTALTARVAQPSAADIIQAAMASKLACPRCLGRRLYRHGEANGLQRFRCCACGKTFNSLTGTPLARLRLKEKWLAFGACLLDSLTVRDAAARLTIDKSTSMRWRHRFLDATKADRPASLNGIVEADETFLLHSKKGSRNVGRPARRRGGKVSKRGISTEQVCILVARDRSGNTHDFVTGRGPVTTAQLLAHLPPILAPDILLVTAANAAYRTFAKQTGISHAFVNLRAGVRVAEDARGAVHVQNVNSYQSRFHGWLRQFNGVATRYLANYLGWRWAIDQQRIDSPETLLRAAIGVFNS